VILQLDKQPPKPEQESFSCSSLHNSLSAWAYQSESGQDKGKTAGTYIRANWPETLGDTLMEKPPQFGSNESKTRSQHLADDVVRRLFDVKVTAQPNPKPPPPYELPGPQIKERDAGAIVEHEKKSWSSRFECVKWAGGVYAAHRWAPQYMPAETPPAALLGWKKANGAQQIAFGGITHAELTKELKARYIATCIGSMAAGWTVSHAADDLFFSHDQYLEGTLACDVLGIGLAITVPDWRRKAVLVAGTHLLGRTIDHWRQPHY